MAQDDQKKPDGDKRTLMERLDDPDLSTDEFHEIIDALMTQDMGWGPARKKMVEAGRRKRADESNESEKGE